MWYFAWILGLGLACTVAFLNAMWLELEETDGQVPEERGRQMRDYYTALKAARMDRQTGGADTAP